MNKWQDYYVNVLCNGELPNNEMAKEDFKILGLINNGFTVHFSAFHSPIESQCHDAEVRNFTMTFEDTDMSKNIISVIDALSNIRLWIYRDYPIYGF